MCVWFYSHNPSNSQDIYDVEIKFPSSSKQVAKGDTRTKIWWALMCPFHWYRQLLHPLSVFWIWGHSRAPMQRISERRESAIIIEICLWIYSMKLRPICVIYIKMAFIAINIVSSHAMTIKILRYPFFSSMFGTVAIFWTCLLFHCHIKKNINIWTEESALAIF